MYTVESLAKLFKIGKRKVQRWIDDGDLEAVDISNPESARRQYRIPEAAVTAFQQRRSTSIPKNDLPKVEEFV